MLHQVNAPLRWVWSHKRRSAGYACLLLIGSYAVVFTMVSCGVSPTDLTLQTDAQQTLAYRETPGGNPDAGRVVLIHGAPADAGSWNKLLKRADEIDSVELIAIDRIGYGRSTREDELTLAGHAASIAPLLLEVNGKRSVLVGHSYGGPVALRLAVDYPDQVGGLVLVAGACDAYMNDAQWFRRLVDGGRLLVPEPWERANRELLALTDENRAMEPMLDRVTCPVVVVHGTWDGVCPHDSTIAYLRERLINAESFTVVSIERAGHNLQISHIDQVVDAINDID